MQQLFGSSAARPWRAWVLCVGVALPALAAGTASRPAWAQAGLNCQTIEADVQAEQPTALPTVSGRDDYTLEGRTSEQVIQQWATIQDPDPQACHLMRDVQRRLATEDEFARSACPDVLAGLRSQAALAKGEASILCRGRN